MASQRISSLLIEEYFSAADERFLPALRQFHDPKKLASIVEKWKRDHRPWAREQILRYLEHPFDAPGHELVVKRLFKHAEAQRDDELMAHFAAAFDGLVRREKRRRVHYNWETRERWQEEYLHSPRNTLAKGRKELVNPNTPQPLDRGRRRFEVLFSYHTRHYLRRRAWRYFRRMGIQRPGDYPVAVAAMLRLYRDEDVATGASVLDRWSLAHACFADSDVLSFGPAYPRVKADRSLAQLTAAPAFEPLWRDAPAARLLVSLLSVARSRAVRTWAIQLLRRHHLGHAGRIGAEQLLPLLEHADEQIQHFAAEALERAEGLGSLPLEIWLRTLSTQNILALEILARLMRQYVPVDRLTLEQLVQLTASRPVPVARLGLEYLKQRTIATEDERQMIARLAAARSPGTAGEIAAWALSILGTSQTYHVDHASAFFDSLHQGAREAAWAWLVPTSAGWNDPALWSRLIESPYHDVRIRIIEALEQRQVLPGAADDQVTLLWTSVLLNVHRGGRSKLVALRQISRAVQDDPLRAEALLPVLAVAIRSVRLPEARAGLAAVVAAVEAHPPLLEAARRALPELHISEEAAAR